MAIDFVSIDFETACPLPGSICAVGLARVRNGVIVDSCGTLVNPESQFSLVNIGVHGITPEDVECAPTWGEVWPEIKEYIGNDILVAHNAVFDMAMLRSALGNLGEQCDYTYACTLMMAYAVWPGLECYKLSALCESHGIPLDHHNAKSDAEACAQLAIIVAEEAHFTDVAQLVTCRGSQPAKKKHVSFDEDSLVCDPIFRGKKVRFTGEMYALERQQARAIAKQLGARLPSEIRPDLDYLVVGKKIVSTWNTEGRDRKVLLAKQLQVDGAKLQIVDEETFLKWITGAEPFINDSPPAKAEPPADVVVQNIKYEDLFMRTKAACGEEHLPSVTMNITKGDKAMSVYFYGRVMLRFVILKKSTQVYVDYKYVDEPDKIAMNYRHIDNTQGNLWRFAIDEGFNWEAFNQLIDFLCEEARDSASPEMFGCCNSFIDCSDAKKCLHQNDPEYLGCYYRQNLEAGRIFYGVNKNI
ncbi:MAG: exonuclease domain-containing protein [Clostridia bacterium]